MTQMLSGFLLGYSQKGLWLTAYIFCTKMCILNGVKCCFKSDVVNVLVWLNLQPFEQSERFRFRACAKRSNSSIMALVHGEGQDRWYFSKEELQRTPSVLSGIDVAKELSYRQQSANLIQDMGQRLLVSQLTINTAIVYMHRFYMFHSFSDMNRNDIAPCCLFLSAKLEEQPRKLEHVIKVANICLQKNEHLDPKSETYLQQAQDLVINESILLQTLGFELTVDHPHTHVVRITQLVRASKDLAQTSYFMATNSLHLTPFCIQHKPSVVACVCIHLACKWSNWEFPRSSDNKEWWEYVDPTVTKQTLDTICQEFLTIIENCPNRLKRRISTVTIYKGGHRPKSSGEKVSKSATPTNGDASTSKGESSSKSDPSLKAETSNNADHSVNKESVSRAVNSIEQSNEQSSEHRKSAATLTITSSAAVVETPTSTVMLPPLQPLTTKYATMPGLSSNSTNLENQTKSLSGNKDNTKLVQGTKHKHREHDESSTPSKKLKTMHSSSSHGSQSKHSSSSRPPSNSKHSSHQSSKPSSSHSTPGSHHSKLPMKSGSYHSGQPHHNASPKLPFKSSSSHNSHPHYNPSPKLPIRSSSGHGGNSSQSHHSSSKRHSYPGHHSGNHSSSHSSANKLQTSHKHSSSPLDGKKSGGERHRRPSSSSRPKHEMAVLETPTVRTNDIDKTKRNVAHIIEDFASPPGPQRLQKFPPHQPMTVTEKSSSLHGPPLPTSGQATPPPPPLPASLPPPPPPPPT